MNLGSGYENAIKKVLEYQKCHPSVGYYCPDNNTNNNNNDNEEQENNSTTEEENEEVPQDEAQG